MSVASVARDFAGPPGLSWRPSDPVTLKNVSGLSDSGLCRATGTLPGHRYFPEGPETQWPWEMSVASVAWDFAGPPGLSKGPVTWWPWEMSVASVAQNFAGPTGLSRRPSDLVTLRNVSGLSGPGLSRRPSDPVTMRNVHGLRGPGLCWACTHCCTQWSTIELGICWKYVLYEYTVKSTLLKSILSDFISIPVFNDCISQLEAFKLTEVFYL